MLQTLRLYSEVFMRTTVALLTFLLVSPLRNLQRPGMKCSHEHRRRWISMLSMWREEMRLFW